MSAPLDCPALETWRSLLGEDGPPEDYAAHLESCPLCQERLDHAIDPAEPLVTLGRRIGDPRRLATDSTLSEFLERLQETSCLEPPEPGLALELSFLRPDDRPGLLGTLGEYEVLEVIGQGGMGIVLKAFEPALHRLVAIKVMAPGLAGNSGALQRFRREVQAAAAVCHENVVAVHGVHEANGLPYLVMQHVAGESLQARLDRVGPLDTLDIVRIGMQTASGLAAAHAQGLVHRDVKPANLLLEETPSGCPRVKITDFGLARMVDDVRLTRQGFLAGTPEYMAPEQARGETIDHRADLFSLGSVLHAMCTGTPPFRGSTTVAVLRQVSDQSPPSIREANSGIPAWLEGLVMRLMAKDPAQRIQTAAEVAGLLEGYLASLRAPATVAPPAMPPSSPGPRRLPRRFLLWLVILLLAGAGLIPRWFPHVLGQGDHPMADGEHLTPTRLLRGHTGPVHDVRFTPDGRIVSVSGWPHGDRSLRIWNLESGQERGKMLLSGEAHSLDLAADARLALVGLNTGQVQLIDLGTLQVVQVMKGHTGAVDWVAIAAKGKEAFSASVDGTARRWSLESGKELARFRVQGKWARAGALFPDGKRLLTGDNDGLLQIWDVQSRQEIKRIVLGGPWMIDSLTVLADGNQALVACVAGARVIDLETGQDVRHFQAEHEEVYQAALSPDGRLLTASFDGAIRLWDFQTGTLLRELDRHEGFAFSVAFSPDGRFAASGGGGHCGGGKCEPGNDHAIRLWDLTGVAGASGKPGSRRWLMAGGIVVLVMAASLGGVWWLIGQGRRRMARSQQAAPAEEQDRPGTIAVHCPGCGRDARARSNLAGKRVKCPGCGQVIPIPGIRPRTGSTS